MWTPKFFREPDLEWWSDSCRKWGIQVEQKSCWIRPKRPQPVGSSRTATIAAFTTSCECDSRHCLPQVLFQAPKQQLKRCEQLQWSWNVKFLSRNRFYWSKLQRLWPGRGNWKKLRFKSANKRQLKSSLQKRIWALWSSNAWWSRLTAEPRVPSRELEHDGQLWDDLHSKLWCRLQFLQQSDAPANAASRPKWEVPEHVQNGDLQELGEWLLLVRKQGKS